MTATAPVSPRDLLRGLPTEAREELFVGLLRELTDARGSTAAIPLVTAGGERLGYYVPQQVADAELKSLPPMTDADRTRTQNAFATLGNTFEINGFLNELAREDVTAG